MGRNKSKIATTRRITPLRFLSVFAIIVLAWQTHAVAQGESGEKRPTKSDFIEAAWRVSEATRRGKKDANLSSIRKDIAFLEEHGLDATPTLVVHFINKKMSTKSRQIFARILGRKRVAKSMHERDIKKLLQGVADDQELMDLRIRSASLILLRGKLKHAPIPTEVRDFVLENMDNKKHREQLEQRLFHYFVGEKKIEEAMLEKLKSDPRKKTAVYVLGKIKSQSALQEIASLLEDPNIDLKIPKATIYLSIGHIGGDDALQILLRRFTKERDAVKRALIIQAIGATQHPSAGEILIKHLKGPDSLYFYAALTGLKFLSDPSVIPVLEKVRDAQSDSKEKALVDRTIDAIEEADTTDYW